MRLRGWKRLSAGVASARARKFIELNQGQFPCACGCGLPVVIKAAHLHLGIPTYRWGHHQLNTGKFKASTGYILIRCPGHPNGMHSGKNYVFEHRLIAEKMIGRILTKDEVVHHKNGVRDDNRPENLEVLTYQQHFRTHYPDGISGRHLHRGPRIHV